MSAIPSQIPGVTAVAKANIYFDGNVISHTIILADGAKKTLGLIRKGTYHFNTGAPERMEIVAGACRVTFDSTQITRGYAAGESFDVEGKSGFTIAVDAGICEYICSFLA